MIKLSKEEFIRKIKTELVSYSSLDIEDISIRKIQKNNTTLEGMSIKISGIDICPTIYLDHIYDEYVENNYNYINSLEQISSSLENSISAAKEGNINIDKLMDINYAKNHIIFSLINTSTNQELLDSIPHRNLNDLSVVYRNVVDMSAGGIASTLINNTYAEQLGLSEEDLYNIAYQNTNKIMPTQILDIADVVRELMQKEGMSDEIIDVMFESIPAGNMYVITNSSKMNGASSILYDNELQKASRILNSNLYILPSSIHECIAIPAIDNSPEIISELANMVNEINGSQVDVEERLSNQVYFYNRFEHTLTLASDTPFKRVDMAYNDNVKNTNEFASNTCSSFEPQDDRAEELEM